LIYIPKKMTNSRNKGATKERWVANAMNDYFDNHCPHLNIKMTRNLDQTRDGGYDILGLDEFAIEIKHYAKGCHHRKEWWDQVCTAASDHQIPVLIYKYNYQPERVVVPIDWFFATQFEIPKPQLREHTAVMEFESFLWFLVCYLEMKNEQ